MAHDPSRRPRLVEPSSPTSCPSGPAHAEAEVPAQVEASLGPPLLVADAGAITAPEAAEYISELTAELAFLARRSGLDLLVYLLEMAQREATTIARSDCE